MTDDVILERADGIAVVTLNRPNALNALSTSVMHALDGALDQLAADRTLRAVVVTQRDARKSVVSVPGRFSFADVRDARGERRVFGCHAVNPSIREIVIASPVTAKMDARVIAYIDHLGKFDGLVRSVLQRGFVMSVNTKRGRDREQRIVGRRLQSFTQGLVGVAARASATKRLSNSRARASWQARSRRTAPCSDAIGCPGGATSRPSYGPRWSI